MCVCKRSMSTYKLTYPQRYEPYRSMVAHDIVPLP
jgi:hypothetical protein